MTAYGILAYQKKSDLFNLQASLFTRYSDVLFRPDQIGDLFFNGVSSRVDREIYTEGGELDMSYKLNDENTLRSGFLITGSRAMVGSSTLVFPADAFGNQTSDVPFRWTTPHLRGDLHAVARGGVVGCTAHTVGCIGTEEDYGGRHFVGLHPGNPHDRLGRTRRNHFLLGWVLLGLLAAFLQRLFPPPRVTRQRCIGETRFDTIYCDSVFPKSQAADFISPITPHFDAE